MVCTPGSCSGRFHQGLFACLSFAAVRGDSHHNYLLCIAYVTSLTFSCSYELISNICGYVTVYVSLSDLRQHLGFLFQRSDETARFHNMLSPPDLAFTSSDT